MNEALLWYLYDLDDAADEAMFIIEERGYIHRDELYDIAEYYDIALDDLIMEVDALCNYS